jgi:uncharacterized membrane protein YidH (DUF202 family)
MSVLFDPGLQPERTELAWRRTALSVGVGSLVAMRLLPEILGDALWALGGVGGLLIAAAIWIAARARLRAVNRALTIDRTPMPGGGMLFAFALVATLIGASSVVLVGWVVLSA